MRSSDIICSENELTSIYQVLLLLSNALVAHNDQSQGEIEYSNQGSTSDVQLIIECVLFGHFAGNSTKSCGNGAIGRHCMCVKGWKTEGGKEGKKHDVERGRKQCNRHPR